MTVPTTARSSPALEFLELNANSESLELLQDFYFEVYCDGFPYADERESFENLQSHLKLKDTDYYGRSNFHIMLLKENGETVAGSISDYLAEPNCGVVEFLLCKATHRGRGLGADLLAHTERVLGEDAMRVHGSPLDFVMGEIREPSSVSSQPEELNPLERLRIWHRWGFRKVDFPYVQPALDVGKTSVRHLMLIAATRRNPLAQTIASATIKSFVHEYMRLAMRIARPADCNEFREMAAFLDLRPEVPLLPLVKD